MQSRIASHAIRSEHPRQVVAELGRKLMGIGGSSLLFVSGGLAMKLPELAQELAVATPRVNWLLLPTVGVLTDQGEIENASAATALLTQLELKTITAKKADPNFGRMLGESLDAHPGTSAFVALGADQNERGWLEYIDQRFNEQTPRVFGGGLLPRLEIAEVKGGRVRFGAAAAVMIPPSSTGYFSASSACRLISPLRHVTRAHGPVIHEMEGMRALDRLSEATSDLSDQPLVMLAVGSGDDPLSPRGRSLALRAIIGIDPSRGALIFSETIPEGARVAFAVRDAHRARTDFQAQLISLKQKCAGSAPEFGIFVSCAGRGSGLYGQGDVDVRLIKKVFPNMPFAGMHSTFELAPVSGRAVPHIYTAAMGLFCRPS